MRQAKIATVMLAALLALLASSVPAVGSTSRGVRDVSAAVAVPGTQLWVRHYHGSAEGQNLATSVAASPTARVVFVTGTSVELVRGSAGRTFNRHVYATVAYNAATGARIWARRYATPGHRNRADALVVSPDGKTVYVTGTSATRIPRVSGYAFATVAYNAATGARIWARRVPAGPSSIIFTPSLAVGPQGHAVYMTGPTSVNSVNGLTSVAYRAGNGHQIWRRRHVLNASLIATSVAASPTGRTVFVTADDNLKPAFITIAYKAATGATAWTARRGGFATGSDGITVAVSPGGGRVFVAATSDASQAGPGPVFIFAYNAATGAREWVRHGLGTSQLENSGKALAVSPDGRTLYATMTDDLGSTGNGVTTAYDAATGAVRWSARFPNSPDMSANGAAALAVNPNGKSVYVTINTVNRNLAPSRFTTISYRAATGAQLWGSSDTEFGSLAMSAAVSPEGHKVFVAGASRTGLRMKYTTIAYRA